MLGAIAGDIIGSVHERARTKRKDFVLFTPRSHFTDDTVLTVAVAEGILRGRDYVELFHEYVQAYPHAGYGGTFSQWAWTRSRAPYGSFGNGSAMRVSPVGFAFPTLEEVLDQAKRSAEVTHDHPEGIRGAQATASAIFLARTGHDKPRIKEFLGRQFGYDLNRCLNEIRPDYHFDVSCQGSVPESILAFLEADGYEDTVRNAVSLGGDADTMACIAGGIAEAFYGLPAEIASAALARLDEPLRAVVQEFTGRFSPRGGAAHA